MFLKMIFFGLNLNSNIHYVRYLLKIYKVNNRENCLRTKHVFSNLASVEMCIYCSYYVSVYKLNQSHV